MNDYVIPLSGLGMSDVPKVGGKNASLGEMIRNLEQAGVAVPDGFATTADAYREFLVYNRLDERINQALDALDVSDVAALTHTGRMIRDWIMAAELQPPLEQAIRRHFRDMEAEHGTEISWAVRSSATAEDLPDASFAGQQETFLNVRGLEDVQEAIRAVFASLYNDRAIAYRVHQGFEHRLVALSAGVQRMVRSDIGASGVIFTLDTETGFRDVVFITASYGLGEMVVQGEVNPDEFYVHKPTLDAGRPAILRRGLGDKAIRMVYAPPGDPAGPVRKEPVPPGERRVFCISQQEAEELARHALVIERHYGRPMDIEWARDGEDGRLYILQARPETVQSRSGQVIERYELIERGDRLTEGRSIGSRIGTGTAKVIMSVKEMERVRHGDVLVTDMTDPDWEPIMKRASAIVTNRGGRTCHAAIIARELGVPAVVGCNDATQAVADGREVTVSCAEGDAGYVYDGKLAFTRTTVELEHMPDIPVKVMMNVGNPDRAFGFASIPNAGVGLARLEFIINNMIGIHPKALLQMDRLEPDLREQISERICAYDGPVHYFETRLAEGVSTLAAAFWPKSVIVRLSDFKSNEYANLLGGEPYEPQEENPMLGFRGASRYVAESFRDCFDMECRALKYVRDRMGLTNVEIMVPFVRTVEEAKEVAEALAANGLRRGENGLRLIMMCEIPSNALLAEQFLEYFDGFSIGSNDLTQLTLGLDRDSSLVAHRFDERNSAVYALIEMAINSCRARGKYIGICGQGPSDHPDMARWLMQRGISSVSLNPDSVLDTWLFMAGEEREAV
jgi:pyruvate,water dikinase